MGGHDGLNVVVAQPLLQAGEERIAGHSIKSRERLIEQKQAGRRREGSRQCDALRLAPGKMLRVACGEIRGADQIQHLLHAARAGSAIEAAQAIGDVCGCGEVREERRLLRDK